MTKINQVFQQYLQSDKNNLIEEAKSLVRNLNMFCIPATFVKELRGFAYINLDIKNLGTIRLGSYSKRIKRYSRSQPGTRSVYGYLWQCPFTLGTKVILGEKFFELNKEESLIRYLQEKIKEIDAKHNIWCIMGYP
jgi:hypothetical protein